MRLGKARTHARRLFTMLLLAHLFCNGNYKHTQNNNHTAAGAPNTVGKNGRIPSLLINIPYHTPANRQCYLAFNPAIMQNIEKIYNKKYFNVLNIALRKYN